MLATIFHEIVSSASILQMRDQKQGLALRIMGGRVAWVGGQTDNSLPLTFPPSVRLDTSLRGCSHPLKVPPGQLTSILTFHEVILGGSGRGCGAKEWRDGIWSS